MRNQYDAYWIELTGQFCHKIDQETLCFFLDNVVLKTTQCYVFAIQKGVMYQKEALIKFYSKACAFCRLGFISKTPDCIATP